MKLCHNCGAEVTIDDKYCSECGVAMGMSVDGNHSIINSEKQLFMEATSYNSKKDSEILDEYIGKTKASKNLKKYTSYWECYIYCLKNFNNFKGKANRKEWFSFFIFNIPITIIFVFLLTIIFLPIREVNGDFSGRLVGYSSFSFDPSTILYLLKNYSKLTGDFYFSSFLLSIYYLFIYLSALSLNIRRLHDSGKSGLFILFGFTHFVSNIIVDFIDNTLIIILLIIASYSSTIYYYFLIFKKSHSND